MILIVRSSFYEDIAKGLSDGAINILKNADQEFEVIEVPGCFELPAAIAMAYKSKNYDAFIALGCVIRGETSHYDYVCSESARGLNDLAINHNLAIGYGIITSENIDQAKVRADVTQKNVGGRAAEAALAMLDIKNKFGQ